MDEILNIQKSASDRIGLGYDHPLSSCSISSNVLNRVIFVPLTNNEKSDKTKVTKIKTENVSESRSDKGKSILGAPPKIGKQEVSTKEASFLSLLWSIWTYSSKLL